MFNKVGTRESGEVSAPFDVSLVKTLHPISRAFILSKLLESCFLGLSFYSIVPSAMRVNDPLAKHRKGVSTLLLTCQHV